MATEVTFDGIALPVRKSAEIRSVVRRIRWPHQVDLVEFVRPLGGGLSGAFVAQVRAHGDTSAITHVVKVDAARVLRAEWEAYDRLVRPFTNAFCAPIEATSLTGEEADDDLAAVVYAHVGQFAGNVGDVRVLEEVVAEAVRTGDHTAVEVLDQVLRGAVNVFQHRYAVVEHASSLRELNTGLGPNLTVEVDDLPRAEHVPDDEILLRSCGGPDDLAVGERIGLSRLRMAVRGDRVLGVGEHIRVRLLGEHTLNTGHITAVRGAATRARVAETELVYADPFTPLARILTEELPGRVYANSHGDLNPRNIMLSGTKSYLIDYARARERRPQQSDFAWLEIGLTRDVLADHDPRALLRLHRVLGLATALLDLGLEADGLCADLVGEELATAFRVLFTVRRNGHRCHPDKSAQRWRDEYHRALFLAAHRTMKWAEPVQTARKLRLSAAVAGASAEWLDGDNPFRHWDPEDLGTALDGLGELLPFTDDEAVRLVVRLTDALRLRRTPHPHEAKVLVRIAGRLVFERCGAYARSRVLELRNAHDGFVNKLNVNPDKVLPQRDVQLVGPSGSGKTAVATELAYQTAYSVLDSRIARYLPVSLAPGELGLAPAALLAGTGLESVAEQAFALGAVRLIVDEVTKSDVPVLTGYRARYPALGWVLCTQTALDDLGEVHELHELDAATILEFLSSLLRGSRYTRDEIARLVGRLLKRAQWRSIGVGRPVWLVRLAGYVRNSGMPQPLPVPMAVLDSTDEEHWLYDAAKSLVGADQRTLREYLAKEPERDVLQLLAIMPDVPAVTIGTVVDFCTDHDPVFAANLITLSRADGTAFTHAVERVLRDADASPTQRRQAAEALTELPEPQVAVLLGVATDTEVDATGRCAALQALSAVGGELDSAVHKVLMEPASEVTEVAISVVATGRLRGYELYLAELVTSAKSWSLVSLAFDTLLDLGVKPPPEFSDAYAHAGERRLAEVEAALPTLCTVPEIRAARKERARLVEGLVDRKSTGWRLRKCFAFDLTVGGVPERFLPMGRDPFSVAYRLFRSEPGRLVRETPPDAPDDWLLVAAAAIHETSLDAGRKLFLRVLAEVRSNQMEGLSALLVAIYELDHREGVELAARATDALAARGVPERHRWPWLSAITRVQGAYRELDELLCLDDESAYAAMVSLATRGFLHTASPGPRHHFSPPARARLLGMPATPEWARAVATAGLHEALPRILDLAEETEVAPVPRVDAARGPVANSPRADVLLVLGHLARRARETGADIGEVRYYLAVPDRHPDVERARLLALAYLGDWQLIRTADLTADPYRTAAYNLLDHWLTTPPTPVADWLKNRLHDRSLPKLARWAYTDLLHHALNPRTP
ncbi:hypothetical protein V5P93_007112 [Actinokineospora auranticolor]|uniref:Ternary complex associated domain-containing protein n=1 Tax=Actinokineospora auranticolor TaxID=155976 RepID=A0A2S6GGW0_9PSEU|nr:hypothetical protein [Actinokineospora auranticolor]PPK64439.1 hypothetical protein CLV40_1192 [Actinokineospora auranticolor]